MSLMSRWRNRPGDLAPRIAPFLTGLRKLRNRHFFLADLIVLCATPGLALAVRLDGSAGMEPYIGSLAAYTALGILVRLAIFAPCGLYRRYWRYATIDELVSIAIAVGSSTLVLWAIVLVVGPWLPHDGLPRSVPLVDGLLALILVGGIRFSIRLGESVNPKRQELDARPVLIMGAGDAGQLIVKELQSNPQVGLMPIGFLDDDVDKQGKRIRNLPVFGARRRLIEIAERYGVAEVIIAMPKAAGSTIRESLALCEAAGLPARTVPGMTAILDGSASVSRLRKVDIEDLLRREPIQTDIAAVRELIRGKRVLITGGGGSIGSELCRQVLECGPSELALLGHGENSVFEIHNELQDALQRRSAAPARVGSNGAQPILHAVIADIRFPERIHKVVGQLRPDIIFHAAAHKHVPLMELHPTEAVWNNVFGTKNLLDAALAFDVPHFVMISTDKAVNPTSVMGASKRAAELLVLQAARRSGRPYVAVRFGNVLGSRGSVVLTFKRQITAGGPVTVSHPEMSRFFITIPEAVQLVLQASILGRCGEIFLLDMGEPVKIVDLARDLIELSGLEVGRDIEIQYTGIRAGEKLSEELFVAGECYQPTRHAKILIAHNASSFVPHNLDRQMTLLAQGISDDDRSGVIDCLQALIPEYRAGGIAPPCIEREGQDLDADADAYALPSSRTQGVERS